MKPFSVLIAAITVAGLATVLDQSADKKVTITSGPGNAKFISVSG